jgi:O-antigen ligase
MQRLTAMLRYSVWVLWCAALVTYVGMQLILPEVTGLASQSMTGGLLASYFAVVYALSNRRKWLMYWVAVALFPVFAVTRTAIVAVGLTLPATLAPLRKNIRIIALSVIAVASVGLFYTPRFQNKMFVSGHGEIGDLRMDNPNFRSTGRSTMWEFMTREIEQKPWFGHGANAQEVYLYDVFHYLTHPHNDWLRIEFDYGYIGTAIFALTIFTQTIHAFLLARSRNNWSRVLLLTGAGAFLPFVILMFTDNIILYCSFFGNLHFMLLGLGYGYDYRNRQRSRLFANKTIRLRVRA